MSSRILLRNLGAACRPATAITRRGITTSPQLAHKESSSHDDTHDVTKHKDDLLSKHKQGKGHWKPELASESEEAVKADRDASKDSASGPDHVKDLQERTKHHAEQTSKSGTSTGEAM